MTTTEHDIQELGRRWAEAEQRGDTAALTELSTGDFTLVGPAGFVLEREQWFGSYRSGALEIQSLSWDDVRVRDYGDTAVAIGVRTQEATYQGTPAGGRFRGTHIAVRRDGRWLLAGVHLSPMAGPPAA
jgi:ketosteroid isomerase-like protein